MNKRFWLIPLILFWFLASAWWYLCRIKGSCPEEWKFNLVAASQKPPTSNFEGPIAFSWNSSEPTVYPKLDTTISEIMDRMGPRDTLIIVGTYYDGESGSELGMNRAESIWQHLNHYIDNHRIKTEFAQESIRIPQDTSAFEAIQFRISPAKYSAESEMLSTDVNEQQQKVFKLTVWFRDRTAYKILTPETDESIRLLIDSLKACKSYRIDVVGHTDDNGQDEESYVIGRQRAWAIKKMLWDGGLDPSKIFTDSKGGTQPRVPGDPQRNQRVEVFGIPYK